MSDEMYEDWKKRRAETKVPEGFAGRVMEQVVERETERRTIAVWFVARALPRLGRIAICLLAALAGLVRMSLTMSALGP